MIALNAMRGQLKLGLRAEAKKETLLEEVVAFAKGSVSYTFSRVCGIFALAWGIFASGFTFGSASKFYIQRKLYRRKGQLAFPLAHASLLGVSFSLLFFTSGFGEFLYRQTSNLSSGEGAVIVIDQPAVATEESDLLKTEVQSYTVQGGDTLYDIAQQFRLSLDALVYANDIGDPFSYTLSVGEELTIPPVEGLVYEVKKGDTLEKIAKKYQVDPIVIVEFNYLFSPYELAVGTELIVPHARIPKPKPKLASPYLASSSGGFLPAPTGACGPLSLTWPSGSRTISQGYWYGHRAIDISGYAPLYASAGGTVVYAGWKPWGYGLTVWVNIGGGYQIRYAHMSKISVGAGQQISAGQVIGAAGATGWASGSHLHFELLCNGTKINPLIYLK